MLTALALLQITAGTIKAEHEAQPAKAVRIEGLEPIRPKAGAPPCRYFRCVYVLASSCCSCAPCFLHAAYQCYAAESCPVLSCKPQSCMFTGHAPAIKPRAQKSFKLKRWYSQRCQRHVSAHAPMHYRPQFRFMLSLAGQKGGQGSSHTGSCI